MFEEGRGGGTPFTLQEIEPSREIFIVLKENQVDFGWGGGEKLRIHTGDILQEKRRVFVDTIRYWRVSLTNRNQRMLGPRRLVGTQHECMADVLCGQRGDAGCYRSMKRDLPKKLRRERGRGMGVGCGISTGEGGET